MHRAPRIQIAADSKPEDAGRQPFRFDLQGLRAIAILLVVLAHSGVTFFAGGFVGVDVFFVLSGYLITGLLLRELDVSGRIAFIRFYARRLKRLLPALIVMLSATSGIALWLLSEAEARAQLASAPFSATWTSNLYFSFTAHGYFEELPDRDLFLHTWSLGVEEQFYLVWPLVLLGIFLIRRQSSANRHRVWLPTLGLVLLASFAISQYWSREMPHAAFYLMPSRIWQFALGAMVWFIFDTPWLRSPDSVSGFRYAVAAPTARAIGLAAIAGSAVALHPNLTYPGFWALLPSLGAALVIAAGHGLPNGGRSPLSHPVLVWLGDRSYSWYLWHWPILILGFSLGLEGQTLPTMGLVLLSLLSAILSYRFVELPFWKGRFSRGKPSGVLLACVLVTAIVAVALYGLRPAEPNASVDLSSQWRSDVPAIYRMPCDTWYHSAKVEPCTFGTPDAPRTVVLLGDSIGAQWFSILPAIFQPAEWRIVVFTKSSCPVVDEDYFYTRIGKVYDICTDWRNSVLDELESLEPDVLIMGSAATYGFTENQWVEGSARILDRLSRVTTSIFVVPTTPNLGFDGPGCMSRHISPDGRMDRSACASVGRLQHVESVAENLQAAARRHPNVHVLDLNDLVCPNAICNAISNDGLVVFRDSQHLTDSFVRSQVPAIRKRMLEIMKIGNHKEIAE